MIVKDQSIALLPKNKPMELFDLAAQKSVWKAKGNKGDHYGIQ